MLKGVLFDMDGVIVDSEPFICEAAIKMFAEHGLTVQPEDFLPFVGTGEDRYIGGVAEKYNFPLMPARDKARTYEIYGEVIKGRLQPLNGVREFIDRCLAKNLKLALATSADLVKVHYNLGEIGLPVETFDAIVSGNDVKHKKPDPEIFNVAAGKLGLSAQECLVVEDAVNGVQAAKAAGSKCLAVMSSFTREQLKAADWISPDLADAPEEALEW